MDIGAIHIDLLPEIRERLLLIGEGHPIVELSEILEELSNHFEALGLCHLLDAADLVECTENLVRSGHARRFFLERSRQEGNVDDRHLALSRTSALLDCIAAGELGLAREIASLSIVDWHPSWEYEEDFCFFRFLHQAITLPPPFPKPEHTATLDRFELALEGVRSPRLDVCRALAAGQQPAFAEALMERLEEIEADLDEERDLSHVQEGDLCYWPRSFVSIEGLALLRLGDLAGMSTKGELPLCPSIARGALPVRSRRDLFREITG